MHDDPHHLPDSSFSFVADEQCACGRHHASRVNEGLSKVVLEEGKLQAQAGGRTQQSAMEHWAILYLQSSRNQKHESKTLQSRYI